jgi:hypothetical protein
MIIGVVLLIALFVLAIGGLAGYAGKQIEKIRYSGPPKDGKVFKAGKFWNGHEWVEVGKK